MYKGAFFRLAKGNSEFEYKSPKSLYGWSPFFMARLSDSDKAELRSMFK